MTDDTRCNGGDCSKIGKTFQERDGNAFAFCRKLTKTPLETSDIRRVGKCAFNRVIPLSQFHLNMDAKAIFTC